MSSAPLWLEPLRAWIGRVDEGEELLTPGLAARFHAALGRGDAPADVENGAPAPTGIHWCIAPPALPLDALGPDGHPALGTILPPVPAGRRMWAGGTLAFAAPLRIGATVRRRSTVTAIEAKQGRSGPLCFVTVEHVYAQDGEAAVTERQDIVYRGEGGGGRSAEGSSGTAAGPTIEVIPTSPTLLFRYSAVTFNGHRIHYDLAYARDEEHYPGLVVHGPLQATWMLQAAERAHAGVPRRFGFRGLSPLICGNRARLSGLPGSDGMALSVQDDAGTTTMTAQAEW